MGAAIVLTGLSVNDPTPGVYIQTNFAQGPAAGSGSVRSALIIANATASGTATRDTVVYGPDTSTPIQTEQDWINLFGAGSEHHRAFRRFTRVNQVTSLYGIAVTSSGGTAASGTIVYATTATANGNTRVFVGTDFVDTAIASGQTAIVIATAVVASINAQTSWPVTAANAGGTVATVTLTAKIAGPRGNQIMFMANITSGIGTTATAATDTALTSGATADSNVTALATLLASKYYYIISAANDATQLGALAGQVSTQSLPLTGIRQRVFAGSTDTLSNTITLATGLNNARADLMWLQTADLTGLELAANNAALYALLENSGRVPRHNFSGFPASQADGALWSVPAPRTQANWPTRASILSALNNGITPIGVNTNGSTYNVKACTTYSLTSSVNDYRIRDHHKVTECDFYADDLFAKLTLQFGGKDLADDVAQGQPPPGPQVATPGIIKGAVNQLTQDYTDTNRMKQGSTIIANTVVQRETSPTNRVSIMVPLTPIDILDQQAVLLQQVG